jgi:hypothetical protein
MKPGMNFGSFLQKAALAACSSLLLRAEAQPLAALDSLRPAQVWAAAGDRVEADAEGNVYVMQASPALIVKYLAASRYDSAVSLGGKAARQEGFFRLGGAALRNRQQLYLLDEAQRRLAVLNTNLKVEGSLDFLGLEGGPVEPLAFDIGPAGEAYVLNGWDNTILKYSADGRFELRFGGLDYGPGVLRHPVQVAVSDQNLVLAADTAAQRITVFDLFGTYRYTLMPEASFRWQRIRLYGRYLFCYSPDRLWMRDLSGGAPAEQAFPGGMRIRDLALSREALYILTENAVHLYPW